jgi:CBS domain-containing protein
MITVHNLLQIKGDAVWGIAPQTSVLDALKVMADKDVGALMVLEDEKLVGIISERDFARMIAVSGQCIITETVDQYMTREVFTVAPDQTIDDCMALMTVKRIRHLPVVAEGQLVGLISIGDVVKGIISEQGSTIVELENYITGRGFGR